jgi:hypothetical protein
MITHDPGVAATGQRRRITLRDGCVASDDLQAQVAATTAAEEDSCSAN